MHQLLIYVTELLLADLARLHWILESATFFIDLIEKLFAGLERTGFDTVSETVEVIRSMHLLSVLFHATL